jgi:tetratricopeptide (TPR) repeat protein
LEIDDKFSPAYNSRALVLEKLNEQHSAIEDFTRAIQFSPENEIYFHNRACCLRNMNKLHESLKDFQHALDLNRTNPSFFSNRG